MDDIIKYSPVIGVSGASSKSASVQAMMTQLATMGATPVFLGNHPPRDPATDLAKIDALVVMGNNADIDPNDYAGKYAEGDERRKIHPKTVVETKTAEGYARADYEYKIMQKALEAGMPVLGICGGMQRLNVLCGGTLHQHIPDFLGHNDHAQQESSIAPFVPVQLVHIDKASKLGAMAGGAQSLYTPTHGTEIHVGENSMHHQAVETVGKGLRAAAHAESYELSDGKNARVIEAIEGDNTGPFKNQFVLGVQWHPEFSASQIGASIAGNLTAAAQEFAKAHPREHHFSDVVKDNMLSALPDVKPAGKDSLAPKPGGFVEAITKRRAESSYTLGV